MASWFEKGRPALFEALNRICLQIDQELAAELQQTTTAPCEVNQSVGNDNPHAPENQRDQTRPASTGDINWKSEYFKLNAKYEALSNNFKRAKLALEKRKSERDSWQQRADNLEQKIKAAEKHHGIAVLVPNRQSDTSHPTSADTGPVREVIDTSFTSEPGEDGYRRVSAEDAALPTLPSHVSCSPEAARLDSTQGDSEPGNPSGEVLMDNLPPFTNHSPAGEVRIKEEPSSDGAVFVAERSIKKRRLNDDFDETLPSTKVKIESEKQSSSPSITLHHCDFNPQSSQDLGANNPPMCTPRKPREVGQVDQQLEGAANSDNTPMYHRSSTKAGFPSLSLESGVRGVLSPIDHNQGRLASRRGSKYVNKPIRKDLGHGIATLAEDGALYGSDAHQTPATTDRFAQAAGGRLETLLNSPAVPEDMTPLTSAARNRRGAEVSRDELAIPRPRELPFERESRQAAKSAKSRAKEVTGPPQSIAKPVTKSRLRHKPMSKLNLEDFKINPAANEGHDFAYSDVVRNKNERAHLPGCVEEHCCGPKFRKLAESQRPIPPLTGPQRQEQQRLLEEYLGDYSFRLATMTKEERDKVWLEAKTRELANKYGTHRHRYSRMQSPPGYWNADFPNTQELQAERAEAAKREKQSIQDRYREAMRPGGRWMFRDE